VSLILRQRALEPFKRTETSDLDLNIGGGGNRYVVLPNHIIGGTCLPCPLPPRFRRLWPQWWKHSTTQQLCIVKPLC